MPKVLSALNACKVPNALVHDSRAPRRGARVVTDAEDLDRDLVPAEAAVLARRREVEDFGERRHID